PALPCRQATSGALRSGWRAFRALRGPGCRIRSTPGSSASRAAAPCSPAPGPVAVLVLEKKHLLKRAGEKQKAQGALLDPLLQAGADEVVELAVEHLLGGAFLDAGAQV